MVLRLLDVMQQHRLEPHVVSFNAVMHARRVSSGDGASVAG